MDRLLPWVKGAVAMAREVARLVLRRPVVGVLAVPVDRRGRVVLMRRGDTGAWCLPGGMVEWGEPLVEALRRELIEETGYRLGAVRRVVGVYSAPDRDPRLHTVTVVVEAEVDEPPAPPALNPFEVREVGAFALDAVPSPLGFDTRRMLDDYRRAGATVFD
jgi:8-oxo-dGTP diphosphatase